MFASLLDMLKIALLMPLSRFCRGVTRGKNESSPVDISMNVPAVISHKL